MNIKTFIQQQVEKAANSVKYCEKDLAERKETLYMLEKLAIEIEELKQKP